MGRGGKEGRGNLRACRGTSEMQKDTQRVRGFVLYGKERERKRKKEEYPLCNPVGTCGKREVFLSSASQRAVPPVHRREGKRRSTGRT